MARLIAFRSRERRLQIEDAMAAAKKVLATPIPDRLKKTGELRLEDPELLLCLCEVLRSQAAFSPKTTRDEAEFFYSFVESSPQIGLYDEREYFLGEFALLAGSICRALFRRQEAWRWLERSQARFVLTANAPVNVARLGYQRLALRTEERSFDEVLEVAPLWCEAFEKLELPEDALKCRFLEVIALQELDRTKEAVAVLHQVCQKAETLGSLNLFAQALNNLALCYRALGEPKEALEFASKALPLLQEQNNRIALAKLRWYVGDIFREQAKIGEAVDAYRAALRESEEIGLRGDVAAIHLVLADVLLDAGFDRQAEWEIRAALPIIEEEKMVPEGYAALALLQESLRRRKIDRQALRNLHGFFQDEKS
jgi:tetratricopeptide (TPR) repeat protein